MATFRGFESHPLRQDSQIPADRDGERHDLPEFRSPG
jgi:hypothetical protein